MADQNCGCNGSSSAPPGTTQPTVSSPVGSISSYGGNAVVSRGSCRPSVCPSPPVSEVPERAPYCASWVDKLTTKAAGMLVMILEGCIYKLWSKCSGFVYYDKTTEQISVQDPKYVSAIPKESRFGFLAKVVPTIHTVCVEGDDACQQEIRQELASQVMNEASCGNLVIARAPLCGDVPVEQSGDLDKQVRLDYLAPPNHEDVGCPEEIRFLVSYPGTRGPTNKKVECEQWSKMYRLKLRGSQWGFIPSGSPLESSAKQVVVVQVPGGSEEDPCFELRVLEEGSGGIPNGTANCQMLIWRGTGTEEEGWKAENTGVRKFYLAAAQTLIYGANANLSQYAVFNGQKCNKLRAIVQASIFVGLTGSGAGGSGVLFCNGIAIAAGYTPVAGGFWLHSNAVAVPVTADLVTFSISFSTAGAISITNNGIALLGWEVD